MLTRPAEPPPPRPRSNRSSGSGSGAAAAAAAGLGVRASQQQPWLRAAHQPGCPRLPGGVNSSHPLGGLLAPNLRAVASCGVVGSGRRRLGSPGGGTSTDTFYSPSGCSACQQRHLALPSGAASPCLPAAGPSAALHLAWRRRSTAYVAVPGGGADPGHGHILVPQFLNQSGEPAFRILFVNM